MTLDETISIGQKAPPSIAMLTAMNGIIASSHFIEVIRPLIKTPKETNANT